MSRNNVIWCFLFIPFIPNFHLTKIQFNENVTINHYSPHSTFLKCQMSLFCNKTDSHRRLLFLIWSYYCAMKLILTVRRINLISMLPVSKLVSPGSRGKYHVFVVLLMLNPWSHFCCLLYWNNFFKIHPYIEIRSVYQISISVFTFWTTICATFPLNLQCFLSPSSLSNVWGPTITHFKKLVSNFASLISPSNRH